MQSCFYSATQYFLGANDDAGQLHETGHKLAGQDSSMNMGDADNLIRPPVSQQSFNMYGTVQGSKA